MEEGKVNDEGARVRKLELLRRLAKAEQLCARRKQSRHDAIAFRSQRSQQLLDLCDQLADGTWRPAPGLVFVTTRPKNREVHAARYHDRVVHHLVTGYLAPEIDRRLTAQTFACRKGKGTLAAVKSVQQAAWMLSRRGQVRVWALQMDVVNFFHSINHQILERQLAPVVKRVVAMVDPPFDLGAAVAAIISDRPGQRAHRAGHRHLFARVPPHKRLAAQPAGTGLPIGNLTSQWFANAYLDPLDQFVQRNLGVGGYFRYMDDVVVLSTDACRLEATRGAITKFLRDHLRLAVHADRPLTPVSRGVDFCGYVIRPAYLLPRHRTVAAARQRLVAAAAPILPRIVPAGRWVEVVGFGRVRGPCALWPIDGNAADGLRRSLATTGHWVHAATSKLRARVWRSLPVLARMLRRERGHLKLRIADARAQNGLRSWPRFAQQRRELLAHAGYAILISQLGKTCELLSRRDARRLRLPWPGRSILRGPGVRRGHVGAWIEQALERGYPVALAAENEQCGGKVRSRSIRWWIEPLQQTAAWWQRYTRAPLSTDPIGKASWPEPAPWLIRGRRRPRPVPSGATRQPYGSAVLTGSALSAPQPGPVVPPRCTRTGQYFLPFDDQR